MLPPWFTLILMLLALGVLGAAITIALIARNILRPPRLTDAIALARLHRLSPNELGLNFEDSLFCIRDSATGQPLQIAGWWISASRQSHICTVLLHGHGDAKIGAIAWAPMLHQLNHNVLAIDARAHGESGGRFATAGFFERDDLEQIINQLRAAHPEQTEKLILFGLDIGGTTAAAVAATRNDIAALIVDSPIVDHRRALAAHAQRLGLPAGWMLSAALRVAALRSGADFAAASLVPLLSAVQCPTLLIAGEQDELIDPADRAALQEAATPPKQFLQIPSARHLMAMYTDASGYTAAIASFLAAVEAKSG